MRTRTRISMAVAATAAAVTLWTASLLAQRYPYPYPAHSAYAYASETELKINVTPKDAEVYVDGYYAGLVDDFDGPFQRLRVPSGEHEIAVYKRGHRAVRERLYLSPRSTRKIAGRLEPLTSGQPDPGPPAPVAPAPAAGSTGATTPPTTRPTRAGVLAIRVQPADTELFIDGERWPATPGTDRLLIEVTEGRHLVELRKNGYRPFSTEIVVRPRQTTPLNISLTRM